jgi:hypothetical protein
LTGCPEEVLPVCSRKYLVDAQLGKEKERAAVYFALH